MNTAEPIRDLNELQHLKLYYKEVKPNIRNYLLIIIGLNTALRISDELSLKWNDVYDFEQKKYRTHLCIIEQKTEKYAQIYLNENIKTALQEYQMSLKTIAPQQYLFASQCGKNMNISRVQAFRLVRRAAQACHIEGVISCHSLRKTFGYHAWKQGVSPVLLMNIYNHSSFEITKRYLGIEQDDRDNIYKNITI